jgi:hypothetical protein
MARRMIKSTPTVRSAVGATIGVFLLALGAALLLGLVTIDRKLPSIDAAVSATATITNHRIKLAEMSNAKFPRLSDDRFFVSVAFVSSGNQAQAHEIEVGRAFFDANLPGRQVTVWYFPDRPQVSVIDDPARLAETGSRFGVMLGWVLVAIGAWSGIVCGNRLILARTGYSVL